MSVYVEPYEMWNCQYSVVFLLTEMESNTNVGMEGNIYKNIEPNFYAHVQAALFTVAKRQKQFKCLSVGE